MVDLSVLTTRKKLFIAVYADDPARSRRRRRRKLCGYEPVRLSGDDGVFRADSVNRVYGLYGSFLFIGLFLGLLFIFATVLIIYYKQIIEGYEDKERFEIMKKVGLSNTEIRSAVKSQILTMFFLPLAAAVIHTVFAFPMVKIILGMMGLSDVLVFIVCTAAVVCVFAVCYAAVYALTAKAYYKIVS